MASWSGAALDWLVLVVVAVADYAIVALVDPRADAQDLRDPAVAKTHVPDIVPALALLAGAVLLPPAAYVAVEWALGWHQRMSFAVFELGALESAAVNVLVTDVLKLVAGRPRPYFAEACVSYALGSATECTGVPAQVREARKSFPSGHSSLSFAVATFLVLYIGTRLRQREGRNHSRTLRLLILLLPLLGSSLVAVSRVIDHHHNWSDIVAGSALGAAIATIAFWNRRVEFAKVAQADGHPDSLPLPLLAG